MSKYTNRKGQRYYLKTGKTKSGKARWWASMDQEKGKNAKRMPAGYEWYESVNGQVFVRKKITPEIEEVEIGELKSFLDRLEVQTRFEVKGKDLVIYTADQDFGELESLMAMMGFADTAKSPKRKAEDLLSYSPMLKFTLVEPDPRRFVVCRMCFLGDEQDWLEIDGPGSLGQLIEEYIPLLDDEDSLFELI